MVWHDLALGPATTFLDLWVVLSDEIIDTGVSLPLEVDSSFEQLGTASS
jgi:hypothetical protein